MPSIEIGRIKDSIVRSDNLLRNDIPITLEEEMAQTTNCYAYSLGIMYHGIRGLHFTPGFTDGLRYYGKDTKELMKKVRIDLQNLGIAFRQFGLKRKKIVLRDNEYLIKVFYTPPNSELPEGDFHFVRQDKKTGKWFHKMGWYRQPEFVKSDPGCKGPIPGIEPTTFTMHYDDGFTYTYKSVGYFAITEFN